ncbi:MAG: Rid family hydrolase [Patescibacteria group bacterium]
MEFFDVPGGPQKLGPYSAGVVGTPGKVPVYISGQLAIKPGEKKVIDGTASEQALLALQNLEAVLTVKGLQRTDVAFVEVALTSMSDFAAVGEVYGTFFAGHQPARKTVAYNELPGGGLVEIIAIAEMTPAE